MRNRLLFLSGLFLFMVLTLSVGIVSSPMAASVVVIKPPGQEVVLVTIPEMILYTDPVILACRQYAISTPLLAVISWPPVSMKAVIGILPIREDLKTYGRKVKPIANARSGTSLQRSSA